MPSVAVLEYEFLSALGDKKESVQKIKNKYDGLSKRDFEIAGGSFTIPFYSMKQKVQQQQNSIYDVLKKSVESVVSNLTKEQKASCAIIIGTSQIDWYLVDAINASAYEEKQKYTSFKRSIDSYAKDISEELGLNGFSMTLNTACTSSANAILEGSNLIKSGIFKYVAVVGLEVFSHIMSSGFYSMDLLSKECIKPFDKNRDGLVLGEGVASMLLGASKSSWSVLGGFSNTNSETITSVSQSGDECVEVMQKALLDAKTDAHAITALKTHATGSYSNDLAEMNAISKVFESSVEFTALKPYIGHTIGASGILEIALFMSCIDEGFVPQTLNCMESINKNYKPLNEHKSCSGGVFMCNYFGFGGNNISIIISKELA